MTDDRPEKRYIYIPWKLILGFIEKIVARVELKRNSKIGKFKEDLTKRTLSPPVRVSIIFTSHARNIAETITFEKVTFGKVKAS